MRPFVVNVADLVHKPAARRRERLSGKLADLRVGVAEVPPDEDLDVDTMLEWVSDGLLASGTIAAPWRAGAGAAWGRRRAGSTRVPGAVRAAAARGRELPPGPRLDRPGAAGPGGGDARAAAGAAVPRRLPRAVPHLRRRPQPGRLRLRAGRPRPPVGGAGGVPAHLRRTDGRPELAQDDGPAASGRIVAPWLSPRRRRRRPRAAAAGPRRGGWRRPPRAPAPSAARPSDPTWCAPTAAGTAAARPSTSTSHRRRLVATIRRPA